MNTFKKFLESKDPLKDLEVEMFFRQELGLSKEYAASAREWILDDTDWADLKGDTRGHILEYVAGMSERDIYTMKSADIEPFAFAKIRSVMLKKYGIELE